MFNNLFLANPGSGGTYWFSTVYGPGAGFFYEFYQNSVAVNSSLDTYITAGTQDGRAFVAKQSSSGSLVWQRIFGTGASFVQPTGIVLDSAGDLYVCAYANSGSADIAMLFKYNASGVLQWQRQLSAGSSPNVCYAYDIAIDSSGNPHIIGTISNNDTGANSLFIAKYNSSGTIQWQRRSTGTLEDGNGIAVDSSGNVYGVARYYFDYGRALVVKYNSSGTLQWQRDLSLPTVATSNLLAISVDSSANIYVAGTFGDFVNPASIFIAKYNTSGTLQWVKDAPNNSSYGGGPIKIITNSSSGDSYVINTNNNATLVSNNNIFIVKYNTSGTLQWQRELYSATTDVSGDIALSSDASTLFLSGFSYNSFSAGTLGTNSTLLTAKLPSDGSQTGSWYPSSSMTYAASSYSSNTSSISSSTTSVTFSTASLTGSTPTFTDTAGSSNQVITYL